MKFIALFEYICIVDAPRLYVAFRPIHIKLLCKLKILYDCVLYCCYSDRDANDMIIRLNWIELKSFYSVYVRMNCLRPIKWNFSNVIDVIPCLLIILTIFILFDNCMWIGENVCIICLDNINFNLTNFFWLAVHIVLLRYILPVSSFFLGLII